MTNKYEKENPINANVTFCQGSLAITNPYRRGLRLWAA